MKNFGWKIFMALQFYFIADMLMILFAYLTQIETIFFDYINSRHPNIKFTMEKQVNHKLPFLDVLIETMTPVPF